MILSRYTTHALVALCLFAAACNLASDGEDGLPANVSRDSVEIDFLSPRANGLLSACAKGDAGSCDRAQRSAEISNDGVFSLVNVACGAGKSVYCDLRKGLVDAELRMRGI